MVPSPLLGLLPVIKTVQFEIIIAHNVYIKMSNEKYRPRHLKLSLAVNLPTYQCERSS